MPTTTKPAPLSADKRQWLQQYARREAETLRRVYEGLGKLGRDGGDPTRIKVYAVIRALEELARESSPASAWPLYPAKGWPLSDDQLAYLRGVAGATVMQLEPAISHFDQVGGDNKGLADSVRRLVSTAAAVGVHLHYDDCERDKLRRQEAGYPVRVVPALLCTGEGI